MTETITDGFVFPASMALFLDFDGTLAPFKDNPDAVYLEQGQVEMLKNINAALSKALAIISGRDIRDLSLRVPRDLYRLGNHGLYALPPEQDFDSHMSEFPPDLYNRVVAAQAAFPRAVLEEKGPVLTVHHRYDPKAGDEISRALSALLSGQDGLVVQKGHNIVEVKPRSANKGEALKRLMKDAPFSGRTPVMIGDDTTDEDGFKAAQSLGGLGIKIGEGATCARYRIHKIQQLYNHLGTLI